MATIRILSFELFLSFVLLLSIPTVHAQVTTPKDTTDEFDLSDIPVDDITPPYFGVGGGYQGMLAFMNWDGLNTLTRSMGVGEFSGQLFLNGGGGTAMIALIKNVRVGFYGAGGEKELSKDVTIGASTYARTVRFKTGSAAAQFDYVITALRPVCVIPGLMFGGATKTVEAIQSLKTGESFPNMFDSSAYNGLTGNNSRSSRITNSHLLLYPQLNLEYSPTPYLMVRAGVGYAKELLGDKWTDDAGTEVGNVPSISADGLRVQFGLFVGVFLP